MLLLRSTHLSLLPVLLLLSFALFIATAEKDDPTPIQQRIALLPNGMTVSWSTVGPLGVAPTVAYGLTPDSLNSTTSGWTLHYDPSVTYFHHVPLYPLTPSTRYYWRITSPSTVNSTTLSFTTGPVVGSHTPFTVAINGDMGLKDEDATVSVMKQWVEEGKIDWFWHIGDLSYADDWEIQLSTYEKITEAWMTKQEGIWTERPYMVLPGNHETTCSEVTPSLCSEGQRNFTSFLQRYYMPAVQSGAVNNMFYSLDYGLVHFVSIDTEVDFPNSPEGPGTGLNAGPFADQLTWLKADLAKAAANRAQVPWIVVSGHRPYYSSCEGGTQSVKAAFEELFLQYEVDLVFLGHIHWYERLYPTGANGTVEQKSYVDATAPVYIVTASAGNVEGLSCTRLSPKDVKPFTAVYDNSHHGLGLLTVVNATQLDWSFYNSDNQQLIDTVEIVKAKRWENRLREAEEKREGIRRGTSLLAE